MDDTEEYGSRPADHRAIARTRTMKMNAYLCAVLVAVAVFGGHTGLDWLLMSKGRWNPLTMAFTSNIILGVLTFVLVWRVVTHGRQRRDEVLRRLEIIDQMNHHVRNALQVIAFNVRPATHNDSQVEDMKQAVDRIHWTLREVLPQVEPEFSLFDGSAREKARTHRSGAN